MSCMDIGDFVRARLDEKAETARDAAGRRSAEWFEAQQPERRWGDDERDPELIAGGKLLARFVVEEGGSLAIAHVVANDPAHVLADVEADRRILATAEEAVHGSSYDLGQQVLSQLASKWADHSDYQQEWAP